MVVVRMMMRATCHREMCATCFPEGGVPTPVMEEGSHEPINLLEKVVFDDRRADEG